MTITPSTEMEIRIANIKTKEDISVEDFAKVGSIEECKKATDIFTNFGRISADPQLNMFYLLGTIYKAGVEEGRRYNG